MITKNDINQVMIQAQRGDAQAQCHLGLYYFFGRGVDENEQEALKWFVKADQQQALFAHYVLKGLSLKSLEV